MFSLCHSLCTLVNFTWRGLWRNHADYYGSWRHHSPTSRLCISVTLVLPITGNWKVRFWICLKHSKMSITNFMRIRYVILELLHGYRRTSLEMVKVKGKCPVSCPHGTLGKRGGIAPLLSSAQEWGEWLAARPGRIYPQGRSPVPTVGGWVGPRAGWT
jgi:hypothetical protein